MTGPDIAPNTIKVWRKCYSVGEIIEQGDLRGDPCALVPLQAKEVPSGAAQKFGVTGEDRGRRT
jgi:hypothetical protein